jgi:hypothetical protein
VSTAALPVQVALITTSSDVHPGELAPVAAALQEQVNRDFAPLWHVNATVAAFAADRVPHGHWPIIISDTLDDPGALGYHTDTHRQPIAYVQATSDWTVTVSHELLEMLADPFGSRLWIAAAPDGPGRVRYLIEVADPCEAVTYDIGGVTVSDFATPAWYHTVRRLGHQYSLTGALTQPRQILSGGYVSFEDEGHAWQQVTWFDGDQPTTRTLGRLEEFARDDETLREAVDRVTREAR